MNHFRQMARRAGNPTFWAVQCAVGPAPNAGDTIQVMLRSGEEYPYVVRKVLSAGDSNCGPLVLVCRKDTPAVRKPLEAACGATAPDTYPLGVVRTPPGDYIVSSGARGEWIVVSTRELREIIKSGLAALENSHA